MKYFRILDITYENGTRCGVCGIPFKRGIYLTILEVLDEYRTETNTIVLFQHNDNIFRDELNFKNKIESYLLNNKDLNRILSFKKYENVGTSKQLNLIKNLYKNNYEV